VNAVLRREGAEVVESWPSDAIRLERSALEMLHHDGIAAKTKSAHHRWMPAVLRPDQQSVCASGRFLINGKPDVILSVRSFMAPARGAWPFR